MPAGAAPTTPFNLGMNIDTERVNYRCNREATVSVGSLNNANAWDLYDMHGNVWEWCEDAYKTFSYSYVDNAIDPLCKIGLLRVVRGGGCFNGADNCRSANSSCFPPGESRHRHWVSCDGCSRLASSVILFSFAL